MLFDGFTGGKKNAHYYYAGGLLLLLLVVVFDIVQRTRSQPVSYSWCLLLGAFMLEIFINYQL